MMRHPLADQNEPTPDDLNECRLTDVVASLLLAVARRRHERQAAVADVESSTDEHDEQGKGTSPRSRA
jgi:hypothetical protein